MHVCLTLSIGARADTATMLPAAHVLANMTAFRSAGAAPAKHAGSFLAQKLQQLQACMPAHGAMSVRTRDSLLVLEAVSNKRC